MPAQFEVYEDERREWRFRLRAPNNKIIAQGEGYKTKAGSLKGVERVRKYAPDAILIIFQ